MYFDTFVNNWVLGQSTYLKNMFFLQIRITEPVVLTLYIHIYLKISDVYDKMYFVSCNFEYFDQIDFRI